MAEVKPLVVDLTTKRGYRSFDAGKGDTLPGSAVADLDKIVVFKSTCEVVVFRSTCNVVQFCNS